MSLQTIEKKLFSCEQDLARVRKGDPLFKGDSPDARKCETLEKTGVAYNWPCQDRMGLTTGESICLSSQTINGKRWYYFKPNDAIDKVFRRKQSFKVIRNWMEAATPAGREALANQVLEEAGVSNEYWLGDPENCLKVILTHWDDLSSRELQALCEWVDSQRKPAPAVLPPAA